MTMTGTSPQPDLTQLSLQRRIRRGFQVGCLISVLITGLLVFRSIQYHNQLEQNAFELASFQATRAAAELNDVAQIVKTIADDIASDLSDGTLAYDAIDARMQVDFALLPNIDGLAVTFTPFTFDPELRLYQSYNFINEAGEMETLSGATYDYTTPMNGGAGPSQGSGEAPQTAWYHIPLQRGATWQPPFRATGAGKILIEYGVPFMLVDDPDEPAGVVTIDFSLDDMRALMAGLELRSTGYGFVFNDTGVFLSHPIEEYVAHTTIFQLSENQESTGLADGANQALTGQSLSISDVDVVTGEESWIFFEPIPVSGWVLGIVLNKAEFLQDSQTTMQELTLIVLSAAISTFFILAILLRYERGTTRSLWMISITISVLCLMVIVAILALSANSRPQTGIAVTGRTATTRYIQDYINTNNIETPPYEIPTGIYVQTIDFPDATTVSINGYIWQRYNETLPEDLKEGFRLTRQTGNEYVLEETQRIQDEGDTLIIWYFGMALKQSFNPEQFPFDSRNIRLHMVPDDIQNQIVFTPDLDAYDLINPGLLPGVDAGLTINNWNLETSLFSYAVRDVDTSSPAIFSFVNQPQLFYTINVRRNFLGPLLAYLLPGLVAAGLMFAFILSDPEVGDQEEIVDTLSFTAAIFFVITVAHTALRDSIAAIGITYLEYLYILLYLVIVLASVNSFLVVRRPDLPFFQFRNNLIPKLLYWPTFAGGMLLATLGVFVFS